MYLVKIQFLGVYIDELNNVTFVNWFCIIELQDELNNAEKKLIEFEKSLKMIGNISVEEMIKTQKERNAQIIEKTERK